MLQKDPMLRPTPKDIVELEFIKPYLGEINEQKRQAMLVGEKICSEHSLINRDLSATMNIFTISKERERKESQLSTSQYAS